MIDTQTQAALSRIEALLRQHQTRWGVCDGDPDGVLDGALGALRQDVSTGDLYRKTSALGTLTGWVTV